MSTIKPIDALGVYTVLAKEHAQGNLSKEQFNVHLAYDSINNKVDYEPIPYPSPGPDLVKYVAMRIKHIATRDEDMARAVGLWSYRVRRNYVYNEKSLDLLRDDLKLFTKNNMVSESTAVRTLIYKHETMNESFDSQFYRDCDRCLEIEMIDRMRV